MERLGTEKGSKASQNILFSVGILFLLANAFERLAYYGLTGQMVYIYTAIFGNTSNTGAKYQAVFQSMAFVTPLLGATVADRYIGRLNSLTFGYIPYTLGVLLAVLSQFLALVTWKPPTAGQTRALSAFFTTGLIGGIAVGSGFIRPNLIVLGADQFDPGIEAHRKQQSLYFSVFYWATNFAAFFGFFFMSSLAVYGVGSLKPNKRRSLRVFLVALVSLVAIFCSATCMLLMRSRVHSPKIKSTLILDFVGAVKESWATNVYSVLTVLGAIGYAVGIVVAMLSAFLSGNAMRITSYLSAGLILCSSVFFSVAAPKNDWIEESSELNQGSYPQDLITAFRSVISILRFVPHSIVFWMVYNSNSNFFFMQGCVMKSEIFSWYSMPSSQIIAWNSLAIIILVPVHQKYIYPMLERIGLRMTLLTRSAYGLMWSLGAIAIAMGIEFARKNAPLLASKSTCYMLSSDIPLERDLSILFMIFAAMGISLSEIGYAVSMFEFFYSQSPPYVRSIVQSANLLTVSLGTITGSVILTIFDGWMPDNLDRGHIEYLYLFIIGVSAANLALFCYVATTYEYVSFNTLSDADSLDEGEGKDFDLSSTHSK